MARRATPRPAAPPRHDYARAPLRRRQRAAHGAAHRPLRARPARQRDPLRGRAAAAGRRGRLPATIGGHGADARPRRTRSRTWTALALQSDYSGGFEALRHEARRAPGIDLALDDFNRYAAVAPAGVTIPAKPTTTIGRPKRRRRGRRGLREVRRSQTFDAKAIGVYAQDMVEFAPMWKLLAGLRWDQFGGTYRTYATANLGGTNTTPPGTQTAERERTGLCQEPALRSALPADRAAVLPPLLRHLVQHLGDAYSFDPQGTNTPPRRAATSSSAAASIWAQGASRRASRSSTPPSTTSATPTRTASARQLHPLGQRHAAGIDLISPGASRRHGSCSPPTSGFLRLGRQGHAGRRRGRRQPAGDDAAPLRAPSGPPTGSRPSGASAAVRRRAAARGLHLAAFYAPRFVTGDLMAEYTAGDLQLQAQRDQRDRQALRRPALPRPLRAGQGAHGAAHHQHKF